MAGCPGRSFGRNYCCQLLSLSSQRHRLVTLALNIALELIVKSCNIRVLAFQGVVGFGLDLVLFTLKCLVVKIGIYILRLDIEVLSNHLLLG